MSSWQEALCLWEFLREPKLHEKPWLKLNGIDKNYLNPLLYIYTFKLRFFSTIYPFNIQNQVMVAIEVQEMSGVYIKIDKR